MKENKYNLGLVSVSFRQSTPKEILDAMMGAGLTFIEWGSDVHAPACDTEKIREIAALQKEYGVTCSSYGTYFRLGETPLCELDEHIRAAKILGTAVLRLWCGRKSGADMTERERNELLEECKKAADAAERGGVTLCMECHKNTFTESPEDAVCLMKAVDSPRFRMYWQPFQWQTAEENIKNAKKLSAYAEHIHVFNWKGSEKFPLCEAVEEWRGYLAEFSSPRTLLLEFMPNGSLDELKSEANALKSITKQVLI